MPTNRTYKRREELRKGLFQVLGREIGDTEVLRYCLAFMNSSYAHKESVTGRRPTPKGSYQISEEYFKDIPVSLPSTREEGEEILSSVKKLVRGTVGGQKALLEARLSELVTNLLSQK